jgi:hypothetical protein
MAACAYNNRYNILLEGNESATRGYWTKNSVSWVREGTIPTERPPLVDEVNINFCGYRVHVVSVTDPYGCILGFLDQVRHF